MTGTEALAFERQVDFYQSLTICCYYGLPRLIIAH